jgi:endoglucanase
VTAIRQAGATSQYILIPGTDYTSAGAFLDNGSADALIKITNPDGSTDGLVFDVHKYLDSDNSGTHAECTTDNASAFTALGEWLRENNRKAMLTETGGGPNESSCLTNMCSQLDVLNKYGDVYLGWVGWSAGNFDTDYVLSEVPVQNGNSWVDQKLVTQCIVGKFQG